MFSTSLKHCSKLRSKASSCSVFRSKSTLSLKKPKSSSSSSSSSSFYTSLSQAAVAMAFGVATVGGVSYAVEEFTSDSVPDFNPKGHRFDQSSFAGRFCRMLLACDPSLVFYSKDQVSQYKSMVDNYESWIDSASPSDREIHRKLWEAHRISSASLHPDTGEFIPAPFRLSGYVPYNGPISVFMVASTSTPALLFFAWANQSQNALVNFYNRNASSPMSNETLMKSYGTTDSTS